MKASIQNGPDNKYYRAAVMVRELLGDGGSISSLAELTGTTRSPAEQFIAALVQVGILTQVDTVEDSKGRKQIKWYRLRATDTPARTVQTRWAPLLAPPSAMKLPRPSQAALSPP